MPVAGFDKPLNLPSNDGKFVKLKKLGDTIKFRLANTPHYVTKHFLADKTIVMCGKYNTEDKDAKCTYCEQYTKANDAGEKELAKQLKPVTTFYYPIVDMNDSKPKIFQFTAKSIHYTIVGYANDGVDVFASTWKVERTEEQGNYYKVLRLDEKPFTKEQAEAFNVAKTFKLESKESSSVVLEEAPLPNEE
jgi:hypothetical protein